MCKNPDYCGTADADTLCDYCASEDVQREARRAKQREETNKALAASMFRGGKAR